MGAKVEVKTIPLHGLFIYRKQVWRSLGKLRAESHSTSAQKVYMNEHNTEVVMCIESNKAIMESINR